MKKSKKVAYSIVGILGVISGGSLLLDVIKDRAFNNGMACLICKEFEYFPEEMELMRKKAKEMFGKIES